MLRRFPNHEFWRQLHFAGGVVGPGGRADDQLGGKPSELVAGEPDRRQRRVEVGGQRHVVVSDDRHLVGTLDAVFAQDAERTDRHAVVVREDRRRHRALTVEEFASQLSTGVGGR